MTATFNFNYKRAHQISSEWKTIIDEMYTGGEQRRNQWTQSRKSWALDFDKNSTDTAAIMAFFDARKGQYEAFYWTWKATHPATGESMGGDGVQYLVRFANDKLDISHDIGGYTTFSITLQQVQS
ncbi:MAG: hypothetical protein US20_C0005G0002 [Candidatus Pacebacteria bacterium GW2011_GWF1_36_5]|nr:MAG: hypothetical protein US20_C0005G0002 [Candidatus Pacebacteria bacterium GW2011_GWF1_36_5]